jgi:hypothetical protein
LNINQYLSDGLNIYRAGLCQNRTLGGAIVLQSPETETKISNMLCRFDYTRFVYALDEAIDIDKILDILILRDPNLNRTIGQLLKQSILDNRLNCEKCQMRINGTDLLAEIADMSKGPEWPQLKGHLVEALKAAEAAGAGSKMRKNLMAYRRDVNSIASLLDENVRSRRVVERGESAEYAYQGDPNLGVNWFNLFCKQE